MATVPPSPTLYIRNLDEKIHKQELRKALYYLFSNHGRVMDVVAQKTMKMRGQAHIVFEDIPSATAAMRSLQGFPLFEKPMTIQYARSTSSATKIAQGLAPSVDLAQPNRPPQNQPGAIPQLPTSQKRSWEDGSESDSKRARIEETTSAQAEPEIEEEAPNPPSPLLFISNLPLGVSEEMLSMLFQQYAGFKEVRLVSGKPGIGFVEYETDVQAETAKSVLNGFKLTPTHPMKVEFAKAV
ncbi:hypothetical protein HDU85_000503 [Gaertneriomyces sp. JEL0708]|nr:hypothetical protein HDU85_000503 [Gaertneriomyces sp. JEL0708]